MKKRKGKENKKDNKIRKHIYGNISQNNRRFEKENLLRIRIPVTDKFV